MEKRPKKFLDQVREAIQLKHYSIHTEEAYVNWIRRYILFLNKRHPQEMGRAEDIYTHALHRGGLAVRSPLDQTPSSASL